MNSRTAKDIRRAARGDRTTEVRIKRVWYSMSHKERAKYRRRLASWYPFDPPSASQG